MKKTGWQKKAAGFYLAVAVSAAALGAAAWLTTADRALPEENPQLTASLPSSEEVS